MPKLGHRAVSVVRHCFDQYRNTIRPIPLVCDFVIGDALELAGTTLDRAVDGVVGHIQPLGIAHSLAKTRVRINIAAAARSSGDRDLPNELSKDFAPFGIESA